MFKKIQKSTLTFFALSSFAAPVSWADENKQLLITAAPSKELCQSASVNFDNNPVKSEFCVTQGNFSPDKYVLKIDDKALLKGVDDETSKGISSSYKNHKISFSCAAQNVFPKATPEVTLEEVQKAMPNSSLEETQKIANLLGTSDKSPMGMEVGRLCIAKSDDSAFMTIQVLFK